MLLYRYEAGWFSQFRAVFARSWKTVFREPMLLRIRLIQTLVSTKYKLHVLLLSIAVYLYDRIKKKVKTINENSTMVWFGLVSTKYT